MEISRIIDVVNKCYELKIEKKSLEQWKSAVLQIKKLSLKIHEFVSSYAI